MIARPAPGFWTRVKNSNRAAGYSVSFSLMTDSCAISFFGDSRNTFLPFLLGKCANSPSPLLTIYPAFRELFTVGRYESRRYRRFP